MLIRLIRIFVDSPGSSSIWFLYQANPLGVSSRVDIKKLRKFSERLRQIRNKVFVHIDKVAVFDPDAIYRLVNIKGHEIVWAVDVVWTILNRLYVQAHGVPFHPPSQVTFDSLRQDFKRDFLELRGDRGDA